MLRILAAIALELIANAVGLLAASWVLPDFVLTTLGFLVVVAIFTVVKFVLGPLIFKLSFRYARALNGGVALITTFVGLWITSMLTDGLVIRGVTTWVLATLIVWLCGVLAMLIVPLFLFKKALAGSGGREAAPPFA